MSLLQLNARRCLQNSPNYQQLQCSVCYELTPDMRRCIGPCAKPICPKCTGRVKYIRDICPSKCSQPFLTEAIPALNLRYHCPYRPQLCLDLFSSVPLFERHCLDCVFASPAGITQAAYRRQFKCQEGHSLQMVTAVLLASMGMELPFYQTVMNDVCAGCGSRNLCRAICKTCSKPGKRHVYCVECRRLPSSKQRCMNGHNYVKALLNGNHGTVCDYCGVAGAMVGDAGYAEYTCDVFLCARCYEEMPDEMEGGKMAGSVEGELKAVGQVEIKGE